MSQVGKLKSATAHILNDFDHLDFIWGKTARAELHPKILEVLRSWNLCLSNVPYSSKSKLTFQTQWTCVGVNIVQIVMRNCTMDSKWTQSWPMSFYSTRQAPTCQNRIMLTIAQGKKRNYKGNHKTLLALFKAYHFLIWVLKRRIIWNFIFYLPNPGNFRVFDLFCGIGFLTKNSSLMISEWVTSWPALRLQGESTIRPDIWVSIRPDKWLSLRSLAP